MIVTQVICNRCGCVIEDRPNRLEVKKYWVNPENPKDRCWKTTKRIDLCETCRDAFNNFMEEAIWKDE